MIPSTETLFIPNPKIYLESKKVNRLSGRWGNLS